MKRFGILLLCSLSAGTAGISEVCRTSTFQDAWAKRVHAIHDWNAKHPQYVKAHHLDRDMSAETRRAKERLMKRLELACGGMAYEVGPPQPLMLLGMGHPGFVDENLQELIIHPSNETQSIQPEVYPTYDNPSMAYSSMDGAGYNNRSYPVGWPFFFYVGGYSYPIPLGPPVSHPVGPIAATPEPLPFGIVAIGAAFLIIRKGKA